MLNLASLTLSLSGCGLIATKTNTLIEREGTTVILTKDAKCEAMVPDSNGTLTHAMIVLPAGTMAKIGAPKAPEGKPIK